MGYGDKPVKYSTLIPSVGVDADTAIPSTINSERSASIPVRSKAQPKPAMHALDDLQESQSSIMLTEEAKESPPPHPTGHPHPSPELDMSFLNDEN